jgi:hypothetical protein
MTIIGVPMTEISLGLTIEFYMALVQLISATTKSSFFGGWNANSENFYTISCSLNALLICWSTRNTVSLNCIKKSNSSS